MKRARVMQAVVLAASIVAVGTLTGCEDGYKVFVDSAVLYPTAGNRSGDAIRLDRNESDVFVIPAGVPGLLRVGFESQTQYATCTLNLDGSFVLPVTRVSSGLFYVEQRVPAFTAGRSARGNITCQKANAWPATTFVDTFDLVVVRTDQRVSSRPAAVDFGSVRVGESSVPRDVVLTNVASKPVVVTGLSFTGAYPADYRITGDACSQATLRPRGQCRVQVAFVPTSPGALSALLRVYTSAAWVTEQVLLTGVGVASGAPAVQLEPVVLAFGEVEPGQAVSNTVFVTNTGTATLTIGRISITGGQTSWFSLQDDACSGQAVAPNAQCRLRVAFAPTEIGYQSASLTVPSNAGTSGIQLTGTGAGPRCSYPYC